MSSAAIKNETSGTVPTIRIVGAVKSLSLRNDIASLISGLS